MKIKKNPWMIGAMLLLLIGGAGTWWWMNLHHGNTPQQTPRRVSDVQLPEFTLSIREKDGATGYLVMGMTVAVNGPEKLPTDWMTKHEPQVRAAVLSSLLNLPDIAQANSSKSVRDAVRKSVSTDMDHLLKRGYATSSVYLTKLIVQ